MSDDFMFGVACGGLFMTVLFLFVVFASSGFNLENQSTLEVYTIVDHDISDNTVYTSSGDILTTNKYQWKRLELNKTYSCKHLLTGIYDCVEMFEMPLIPQEAQR